VSTISCPKGSNKKETRRRDGEMRGRQRVEVEEGKVRLG
jgi:hypothetical protein